MTNNDLPTTIPIFPLTGAILLPKGLLPLNIFEPRYKEMIDVAHKNHNVIGMIQPRGCEISAGKEDNDMFGTAPRGREIYDVGCAGLISEIKKTNEDQYFIILKGIKRFNVIKELPRRHEFREVEVCFDLFAADGSDALTGDGLLKEKFFKTLAAYLKHLKMKIDITSFKSIDDEELINSMAMICPFDAAEKQMLVEIPSVNKRAELMMKIMDFNLVKHNVSLENNIH